MCLAGRRNCHAALCGRPAFQRRTLECQVGHAVAIGFERRQNAAPRNPGGQSRLQGICPVGLARPTNGGTDGSTGPLTFARITEARPAAHARQRIAVASR